MFLLKLLIAIVQAPLRRVAELLGLDAGPPQAPSAPAQEPRAPTYDPAAPTRVQEVPSPLHARPQRRRPARRGPPTPPPSPKAKEVDEEPVLSAEFADEGAEDGAGAEVHIEEPWEGYSRMRAGEIKDRLALSTPAELAAVQLYESTHRARKSVLSAVATARTHG